MKCTYCGAEYEGNFCPECGAQSETTTPPPIQNQKSEINYQQPEQAAPIKPLKKKKPFYKKWWFIAVIILAIGAAVAVGVGVSKKKDEGNIKWSDVILGDVVPEPTFKNGELQKNAYDALSIYFYGVSDKQYKEYVEQCRGKGFNVDVRGGDAHYYVASNLEGYHLSLSRQGDGKDMYMYLTVPPKDEPKNENENGNNSNETPTPSPETTQPTAAPTEAPATTNGASDKKEESSGGIRSGFKEAMDSYEAFMNEYVAFMKKYEANPTDVSLLSDYASYMSKYAEMVGKFDKWESEDLNSAEMAYYIEVQARVSKKLLEVAQ